VTGILGEGRDAALVVGVEAERQDLGQHQRRQHRSLVGMITHHGLEDALGDGVEVFGGQRHRGSRS